MLTGESLLTDESLPTDESLLTDESLPTEHLFGYTPVMHQRSFDDLGQPLYDVTFCVIDLETTGGSPKQCGITEVGAVKVRGGEVLGTLQTLINPGLAIPPEITVLTGITQAMVLPAPRIEAVLPTLLEFIGDAVIVGHNVRFDVGFLDAALTRSRRPTLPNRRVDTVPLARRLLRDEVPNCRLSTLADRLRLPHRPSHRALDDALATTDLLHLLIERAGRLGVTGLDDLLALPKLAGHPQAQKLSITDRLPRERGVYLFRDHADRVLYVGKAANLRQRVRSYFSTDDRRKVPQMLRETHRVDHLVTEHELESAVTEIRLIHQHQPRFNAQIKRWKAYTYLKLTRERFPRLSITKVARDDAVYLGPLPSNRIARLVAEAIESAVPIRRCTARPAKTPRAAPCTAAQLGVATCPCAGTISESDYQGLVETVVAGLTMNPSLLLTPLETKMRDLAAAERYEEAASVRDRAAALAHALDRRRRVDQLRRSPSLVLTDGRHTIELHHGLLVDSGDETQLPLLPGGSERLPRPGPLHLPPPRDQIDELVAAVRWIDQVRPRLQVLEGDEIGLIEAPPPLPRFQPGKSLVVGGRHR